MSTSPDLDTPERGTSDTVVATITGTAAAVAGLGVLGSLYLSINLGLKACPLCLYERVFVMGALGVLVTGLMFRAVPRGLLCVLAVPAAVGGLAVTAMHVLLESRKVIECPQGIFGFLTAPQESLAMFALLTTLLAIGAWQERIVTRLACAAALGGLFAWGALQSTPPLAAPTAPYPLEVNKDGCRKVYVPDPPSKI